jgi:hypothetical protein
MVQRSEQRSLIVIRGIPVVLKTPRIVYFVGANVWDTRHLVPSLQRPFQSGQAGRNIDPPAQQNGNPDEVGKHGQSSCNHG